MMLEVRRGLLLVACVSVGFVISAGPSLVARAAEPIRWTQSLTANGSPTNEAAQRRIAELEERVKELEAERTHQSGATSTELAAAHARNHELAVRNAALTNQNEGLAQRGNAAPTSRSRDPRNDEADAKAQLRYWAKQIRDGESFSRRLSPEWNAAVNVLLRPERQLDPKNPWRE